MANTALNGPAHRIMRRMPIGSGGAAQPVDAAPSLDMAGSGIMDCRLQYNTANSSTGAQCIGWQGEHPVYDFVPATAAVANIAAAAIPVAGTPMTLVSSTGSGVVVGASPTTILPFATGNNVIPTGAVFIDAIPTVNRFGGQNYTLLYSAATMCMRCIQITSVGNDSAATMALVGFDSYGQLIHQTVTLTNASVVATTKAFKGLISATPAGTLSGSNVSIGVADTIGLPMYASAQTAMWGFWNNLIIQGAGTFTAGVTTAPSATTGDVRGTWVLPSASNGTKALTLWMHPSLGAMVSSGINIGTFGNTQF